MKGTTLYLSIAAGLALVIAIIYYFQQNSSSAPTTTPNGGLQGIGDAITGAIQGAAQFGTGSSDPLQNEDNGIIFGGGS
jgi:hypothetical protein